MDIEILLWLQDLRVKLGSVIELVFSVIPIRQRSGSWYVSYFTYTGALIKKMDYMFSYALLLVRH